MQKPLLFARELVAPVLKEGAYAVDATCGNGHDTLFLAEQVGITGQVLAFDIQEQAIQCTKERLAAAGLEARVTLLQASHAKLAEYMLKPLDAVMFNLGYLPGGDHNVITQPDTTLTALEAALAALKKGGVITLIIYTGHTGGREEYTAVTKYLATLPQQQYTALEYRTVNQKNNPPLLLAVSRL